MTFEFRLKEPPAVMRVRRVGRHRVLIGGGVFRGTIVEPGDDAGKPGPDDGRRFDVEAPTCFTRPPTSLDRHGGRIPRPVDCRYPIHRGEHKVVAGRSCRSVTADDVWDDIERSWLALDMRLQDLRDNAQGSALRVGGADTLLPIGPAIVRGVHRFEPTLRTDVNGRVVPEAQIGDEAIGGPHCVVAGLARHITLPPSDAILTGTPCRSRSVDTEQLVECGIIGIGRIAGNAAEPPAPRASAPRVRHQPAHSSEVRRVAPGLGGRVAERFKGELRQAKERS